MCKTEGKGLIVLSFFSYNEKKNCIAAYRKIDLKHGWNKLKETEKCVKIRAAVILEAAMLLAAGFLLLEEKDVDRGKLVETAANEKYIKWVDFDVSYEALCKAYEYDVETYDEKIHLDWIELLAYVAAENGGDFGSGAVADICKIAGKITSGEYTMEEITTDMKYYAYYQEAYSAVLGGLVGEYELEENGTYVKNYGLKGFSPIAKGFEYSDYDDFGVSREYGYQRQHLGHDMMGQVGTPIRMLCRTD